MLGSFHSSDCSSRSSDFTFFLVPKSFLTIRSTIVLSTHALMSSLARHSLVPRSLSLDPAQSLTFLSTKATKLADSPDDLAALILASMEAAHWQLITGDAEACKESIDKCEKLQEGLPGVEPVINASFYRVSADYYKVRRAPASLVFVVLTVSTLRSAP